MIRRAVVLAAGLGTRLVPYSKEMPKEMLPIFIWEAGGYVLKPILQIVFEQLYDAGVREFFFVVGRGKRAVENHFTPDWEYVNFLRMKKKYVQADMLEAFYRKVEDSFIGWVYQPVPKGTGDAVLRAERLVDDGDFIVAAGDNLYIGENVPRRLVELHDRLGGSWLTVKRVADPRKYGVVSGKPVEESVVEVEEIVEKPPEPKSDLANTSLYIFSPEIFDCIRDTRPSPRGEIEITSSIQLHINRGGKVYAYVADTYWVDVGTPETYLEALIYSLKLSADSESLSRVVEILNR